MKTFRRFQGKLGGASLKAIDSDAPEAPRVRQGIFSSRSATAVGADAARPRSTSPPASAAELSPRPRRKSSRSPMESRRGTLASTLSLGILDSPPKDQSSPRPSSVRSPNATLIEPETLQTLTEHIRSFSESMNALLATMANEEPGSVRKTVAQQLLEQIRGFVEQTAGEAQLDWTQSVLPLTDQLVAIIQAWDDGGTQEPAAFSQAADELLRSYTKNISGFLRGGSGGADGSHLEDDFGSENPDDSTDSFRDELLESLVEREDAIPLLFQRSKIWSRFAKEIIGYIEKRAQIHAEFSRKLVSHAKTTLEALGEFGSQAGHTPWSALMKEHSSGAARQVQLHTGSMHFFHTQPLIDARNNHEKTRKQLKENWGKECKRLTDASNTLAKAKAKYESAAAEWEKSLHQRQKEEQTKYKLKLEKRSKEEGEVRGKVEETRRAYALAIAAANAARDDLDDFRETVIASLLDSMFASSQSIQDTLAVCQRDEFGVVQETLNGLLAIGDLGNLDTPTHSIANDLAAAAEPQIDNFVVPPPFEFETYRLDFDVQAFLQKAAEPNLCTVEGESSSLDVPPTTTPPRVLTAQDVASQPHMHAFVKHNIPSKCKHCKHACYFQAVSCTKCGIVCHRKCTELLQALCTATAPGVGRLRRTSSVFGSPLAAQGPELMHGVPIIVSRITAAIEERGLECEGLYRLSAVKSHVERLCADFESNPRSVPISHVDIHVLSAVLKLYFRQLPESVIPTAVTKEYIQVARERAASMASEELEDEAVKKLAVLIEQLPPINLATLAAVIVHLRKVSQLSAVNKMKPSNLGIVFGPTLLRSSDQSLDTLIEMPLQSLLVELMVKHCDELFGHHLAKRRAGSGGIPFPTVEDNEDEDEDPDTTVSDQAAADGGPSPDELPVPRQRLSSRRSGGVFRDEDFALRDGTEALSQQVPELAADTDLGPAPSTTPPAAPLSPAVLVEPPMTAGGDEPAALDTPAFSRNSSYASAPGSPPPSPPPSASTLRPPAMKVDPNSSGEGNNLNLALALIEQAMENDDEDEFLDSDSSGTEI